MAKFILIHFQLLHSVAGVRGKLTKNLNNQDKRAERSKREEETKRNNGGEIRMGRLQRRGRRGDTENRYIFKQNHPTPTLTVHEMKLFEKKNLQI